MITMIQALPPTVRPEDRPERLFEALMGATSAQMQYALDQIRKRPGYDRSISLSERAHDPVFQVRISGYEAGASPRFARAVELAEL